MKRKEPVELTKMIGGFIEQQDGWIHKQSPCQSNPHSPASREVTCFLFLHLLVKTKTKQDLSSSLLGS